jgi:hypothetical protein
MDAGKECLEAFEGCNSAEDGWMEGSRSSFEDDNLHSYSYPADEGDVLMASSDDVLTGASIAIITAAVKTAQGDGLEYDHNACLNTIRPVVNHESRDGSWTTFHKPYIFFFRCCVSHMEIWSSYCLCLRSRRLSCGSNVSPSCTSGTSSIVADPFKKIGRAMIFCSKLKKMDRPTAQKQRRLRALFLGLTQGLGYNQCTNDV